MLRKGIKTTRPYLRARLAVADRNSQLITLRARLSEWPRSSQAYIIRKSAGDELPAVKCGKHASRSKPDLLVGDDPKLSLLSPYVW